jgi:hypothetical protein
VARQALADGKAVFYDSWWWYEIQIQIHCVLSQ